MSVGGILREVAASEVFNVCFSVITASLSWYYSLGKTNMGPFEWAAVNARKGEWGSERCTQCSGWITGPNGSAQKRLWASPLQLAKASEGICVLRGEADRERKRSGVLVLHTPS